MNGEPLRVVAACPRTAIASSRIQKRATTPSVQRATAAPPTSCSQPATSKCARWWQLSQATWKLPMMCSWRYPRRACAAPTSRTNQRGRAEAAAPHRSPSRRRRLNRAAIRAARSPRRRRSQAAADELEPSRSEEPACATDGPRPALGQTAPLTYRRTVTAVTLVAGLASSVFRPVSPRPYARARIIGAHPARTPRPSRNRCAREHSRGLPADHRWRAWR